MPITKQNLEPVSKLLVGLIQRQDVIFQLAQRIAGGTAWHSPDGELTVDLSDKERDQLEEFITQYLDECETMAVVLRAHLRGESK